MARNDLNLLMGRPYPYSPVRATVNGFLGFSAFVTPFLFFLPAPPSAPWPWGYLCFCLAMYLYLALLSVLVGGLIQSGFRLFVIVASIGVFGQICAFIGMRFLETSEGNAEWMARGWLMLRIAGYLLYFVIGAAMILSAKGWILYFWKKPIKPLDSSPADAC